MDWQCPHGVRYPSDTVAKLKIEGAAKFRNFPVEIDFRQYDAL
jgi:hypothetical protein